jgi:glyoxylase-like metal-dependent hydrolase (beta-lactamase superfamily II)
MRTRTKVILGVVAVILLAPIALLLPAHLQVRSVEPTLPSVAQLRALLNQANGPVSIRYVNTSDQQLPVGTLTHSVFLVEWANGDMLMIDTGMSVAAAREFGDRLNSLLGGSPPVVHGTIAQLVGNDVQRVRGVGYTHLHSDHSEGTNEFCAARGTGAQWVRTEFQASEHNFNTKAGARLIAASCLQGDSLHGDGILHSAQFPSVGIVALGGHTPDSTLFAVPVGNTLYLLSGDIVNSKSDLDSDIGKGWVYSYVLVPEHVPRSAMLRRWLKELDAEPDMRVIVSHDLRDIEASGIPRYGATQP